MQLQCVHLLGAPMWEPLHCIAPGPGIKHTATSDAPTAHPTCPAAGTSWRARLGLSSSKRRRWLSPTPGLPGCPAGRLSWLTSCCHATCAEQHCSEGVGAAPALPMPCRTTVGCPIIDAAHAASFCSSVVAPPTCKCPYTRHQSTAVVNRKQRAFMPAMGLLKRRLCCQAKSTPRAQASCSSCPLQSARGGRQSGRSPAAGAARRPPSRC